MKNFDKTAAMRGAKICTRDGRPARILCFDLKDEPYHIVAAYVEDEREIIEFYDNAGFECVDINGSHPVLSNDDLMMADDDYLEKLERGLYDHIGEATEKVDWDYWRNQYAGMALQGLVASDKWRRMEMGDRVCVCVEMADALIEELKKEKE